MLHSQSRPLRSGPAFLLLLCLGVFWGVLGTSGYAFGEEGPTVGVVGAFSLECSSPGCKKPGTNEALLRATGLREGLPLNPGFLALVEQRLLKTGFFARVELKTKSAGGEVVDIVIRTVPQQLIREVRFSGRLGLFESELRKRMFLRPGRPLIDIGDLSSKIPLKEGEGISEAEIQALKDRMLPGEESQSKEIIRIAGLLEMQRRRQEENLLSIYRREGFRGTEIKVVYVPIDATHMDLEVYVKNGRRYNLGKVYVRGYAGLEYEVVLSEFTTHFSGFTPYFSEERFSEAIKALSKRYRDEGFFQVRIGRGIHENHERGLIDVYLDLNEGPKWKIIFEGNTYFERAELLEALTFFEVGSIDETEIEKSIIAIREMYQTAGYYWSDIDDSQTKTALGQYELRFTIDERRRSEVRSLRICGVQKNLINTIQQNIAQRISGKDLCHPLEVFSEKRLKSLLLDTLNLDIGSFFQLEQLSVGAESIIGEYRSEGYLMANVPSWNISGDDEGASLDLTIWVYEGPQTTVGRRLTKGGSGEVHASALSSFKTKQDGPFDPGALRIDVASLSKPYRKRGHALPKISAVCLPSEGESAEGSRAQMRSAIAKTGNLLGLTLGILRGESSCRAPSLPEGCLPSDPLEQCTRKSWNERERVWSQRCERTFKRARGDEEGKICELEGGIQSPEVDVFVQIAEGQRYEVGDTFIHGNFDTYDWVISNEFPMDKGDPLNLADLLKVRGRLRSRSVFASASVETVGLYGDTEDPVYRMESIPMVVIVEEAERRWVDFSGGLSVVSENFIFENDLEYVEANLGGTGIEMRWYNLFEIDMLDSNFAGNCECNIFSLVTFRIPRVPVLGMELLLQGYYDQQRIPALEKEETGGVLELRQQLFYWLFLSFAMENKITANRVKADALFTQAGERLFQPRITTISLIPRARIDFRNNPLNPTSGWYADNRAKIALSALGSTESFLKLDLEGGAFYPLSDSFTLATGLRFGKSFLFGDQDSLQADERFLLGGVRSLRGFDQDSVGPTASGIAIGGEFLVNSNVEVRFPIMEDAGLHGAFFVDGGELVNSFDEFTWNDFRISAGLGIRMLLAGFPLVLDYGLVLDRRPGEPIGAFQLNVGFTF